MAEKCYNPRDRSIKIIPNAEDDLDYLWENFKSPRAQMSCGHNVTPSSLTKWCRILLEEGQSHFSCGNCRERWSYPEVRKMALLTPQEKAEFEEKLSFNAAKDTFDSKKCPGCKFMVTRKNLSNLSVRCRMCTVTKNRTYEFCWQCLREWKGSQRQADRCDNVNCTNKELQILQTCVDVVFESVNITGCPSIRACPTCGSMIKHSSKGCKNITCRRCKVEFCFVCLKLTNECKQTSNYSKPCANGIAPRQTSIPVWQK